MAMEVQTHSKELEPKEDPFKPNQPKVQVSWSFLGMVVVGFWLLFLGGLDVLTGMFQAPAVTNTVIYQTATVLPDAAKAPISSVNPVPTLKPIEIVPNNAVVPTLGTVPFVPNVPAEPAATSVPVPSVPEAPAAPAAVVNESVDIPVPAPPAAAEPCTANNAPYVVWRTVTAGGQPVAQISTFSCVSLSDADAKADTQEQAVRKQLLASVPNKTLDAPPPTPGMGKGGGGGGDW